MTEIAIEFDQHQIDAFCQKYGIRKFIFFGSVVRNDFGPESDIDILVEFESGRTPGYDFFLLEDELTQLLGRKVDLQTPGFLSPDIRRHIISESTTVYG